MGNPDWKNQVDPSLETRDIVRLLAILAVAIRNGEVPPLKIHPCPEKKELEKKEEELI